MITRRDTTIGLDIAIQINAMIPKDHICHMVVNFVSCINLSFLEEKYCDNN